jgi:hypothetical protein
MSAPSAQAEGAVEVGLTMGGDGVEAAVSTERGRASSSPQSGKNVHQRQFYDGVESGGAVLAGGPAFLRAVLDDEPPHFQHGDGGGESRKSYAVVKYGPLYEKVVGFEVVGPEVICRRVFMDKSLYRGTVQAASEGVPGMSGF